MTDLAEETQQVLEAAPIVRVWNSALHRYVDPAAPDEPPDDDGLWIDSDVDPADINWSVRVELASALDFHHVWPRTATRLATRMTIRGGVGGGFDGGGGHGGGHHGGHFGGDGGGHGGGH